MDEQLKKLKNSILAKVEGAEFDKELFMQLEKEVVKKFFDHEFEKSGLNIIVTDIPSGEDLKEKVKEDFEKAIVPVLAELIGKIKKENGISHNTVKVSGSAILNEDGKDISFLFLKNKNDEDGLLVTVNTKKPDGTN